MGVRQRVIARPPPRRFAPTLPTRGRVWTEFAACLIASHRNALTRGRARRAVCHEASRMAFRTLLERKPSRIATARVMENSRARAS